MNTFLISLGMNSYTMSILYFALKPIVNKLLSIIIVIFHIRTLISIIGKILVTGSRTNLRRLLRYYGTAFCSVLALMVLGKKIFKY
jgi:hypothetical protein